MPALAALLSCTFICITDGDTLRARCDTPEGMENITVRVAEIDAPEKRQAFGTRSSQHLAELRSELIRVRFLRSAGKSSQLLDARENEVAAGGSESEYGSVYGVLIHVD
jgi:hypothetical protein